MRRAKRHDQLHDAGYGKGIVIFHWAKALNTFYPVVLALEGEAFAYNKMPWIYPCKILPADFHLTLFHNLAA